MELGFFVGINWNTRKICSSREPSLIDEFMDRKSILDPRDIVGPFTSAEESFKFRNRVSNFMRKMVKQRRYELPVATLQDLYVQNII